MDNVWESDRFALRDDISLHRELCETANVQLNLALLDFEHVRLNAVFNDKSDAPHRLSLTQAMNAIDGLVLRAAA